MPDALLRFDREQCLRLDRSLTREWLEVDSCGGYASSTVVHCNTRRYHGLLVAPFAGSSKRHVFVSRFDDSLHGEDKSFPLSLARYPGLFAPMGHQALVSFSLEPFPTSRFRIGRTDICRQVLLVQGRPICLVRWHLTSPVGSIELRVRPLLPCREADALTWENLDLNVRTQRVDGGIRCRPYAALPAVHITAGTSCRFEADPVWYRQIEYAADLARGYDGHEDNFSPGVLRLPIPPDTDVVVASTIGPPVADPVGVWHEESARRRAEMLELGDDTVSRLRHSARVFITRTATNTSARARVGITAGYPWFGEWGRDTFIALPGLTLSDGARGLETCREVLVGALPFLRDGLLPNIYGRSADDSHYGSADAALWFVRAVRLYMLAGAPETEIVATFLPALTKIAHGYAVGEGVAGKLGIGADDSGLIQVGRPDLNPTWMDAQTANGPVTPRHGCPVEINALWYFLLRFLEVLCRIDDDPRSSRRWQRQRRKVGSALMRRLWLEDGCYLADLWRDGEPDRAVRPNMVIAAALEWSPLTRGKRTDIVRRAEVELLTPFGLRTLEPVDAGYIGSYAGGPEKRDAAYHQGTVWPWLIGFYCEAHLRGSGDPSATERLRHHLDALRPHLAEAGLLHVSEVFDGDAPHRPGGCIAQAWSSAELLRAYQMLERGEP